MDEQLNENLEEKVEQPIEEAIENLEEINEEPTEEVIAEEPKKECKCHRICMNAYKILGIVILVLTLAGGIFIGKYFEMPVSISATGEYIYAFNFPYAIIVWFFGAFFGVITLALGEVICQLRKLNRK